MTFLRRSLRNLLHERIWLLLAALVLFGVVSGAEFAIVLLLLSLRQIWLLVDAFFGKPMTAADWRALYKNFLDFHENEQDAPPDERSETARELDLPPDATPAERAKAQWLQARKNYRPPPHKSDALIETFAWIGIALLLPLSIALWKEPFFSFNLPHSWPAATVVLLGLTLFYLPLKIWPNKRRGHTRRRAHGRRRALYWSILGLPFYLATAILIETRHPYIKPWEPDRHALAAERILQLESIVFSGRHAKRVLRYAEELDAQGDREQAAIYYSQALRLDPGLSQARERLVEWGHLKGNFNAPDQNHPISRPIPLTPAETTRLDHSLEDVRELTAVLVPIGTVEPEIMDAMAQAIQRELALPVKISETKIPLPPHDRRRGLRVGPQWNYSTLQESFVNSAKQWPRAPVLYLVVAPVDLYAPKTNFLFSVSFDWGGILGLKRFGNPAQPDEALKGRAAKQAVSALIKTFPIPPSVERSCVTSYTRSLAEFDAKGVSPAPDTLKKFRQHVNSVNRTWEAQRRR